MELPEGARLQGRSMIGKVLLSRGVRRLMAVVCLHALYLPLATAGTLEDWIRGFAESEIVFARSSSKVPFQPLAYLDMSFYNDSEIRRPDAKSLSFDQTTVSQGAVAPFLLGPRDVVFVGEWLGWSHFDARNDAFQSFEVLSVGVPVGWLRQVDDRWQAAAFVMPLGHRANLGDAPWSWETLGGAFARLAQTDQLWWVFGAYFDVGHGEDTYLPYLGAAWELSDQWTLSAILPWPAILYAPDRDTLFRFGAAPSGASWSLRPGNERVSFTLDSWDLGLSAERRIHGNLWLMAEAGVGGLRGLRVTEGEWHEPEIDLGASPYVSIGINFRPTLPR